MKISKSKLRYIIQEELSQLLSEQSPPLRDTGPWPVPDHIHQQQANRENREKSAFWDMLSHANDPYSPYRDMAMSALRGLLGPEESGSKWDYTIPGKGAKTDEELDAFIEMPGAN